MPDALSPRDVPHGERHEDLQAVDLATTVVVALGSRAAARAEDHRSLAHLVARLAGVDAASVGLSQLCPTCGRPGHGPLRVQLRDAPAASATVHVSLARSGDLLALAVTAAGPVGIDLESVAAVGRAPLNDALLSPSEADALARLGPPESEVALAALWAAKESVLKAVGVGLRVDPRELTVSRGSSSPADQTPADTADRWRLAEWPHAPFPLNELHLLSVLTPPGTIGTVAVVCARRPTLRILSPGSDPLPNRQRRSR